MDNEQRIPIIFWHRGDSWYLDIALKQAEKYVTNVILLGDKANKKLSNNWFDMDLLSVDDYKKFLKVYKYLSLNKEEFELRCFERYFYVCEYCLKFNIQKFILCDSDLLIYEDISEYFLNKKRAFSRIETGNKDSWALSPHCSLWSLEDIISFTRFMIEYYDKNIKVLEEKFENYKKTARKGGICDMTLLYLWIYENNLSYFNTAICSEYKGKKCCIDHAISLDSNGKPNEYRKSLITGCKIIRFRNNSPYIISNKKENIRAIALHCSGGYKNYMQLLFKQKGNMAMFYKRILSKFQCKM